MLKTAFLNPWLLTKQQLKTELMAGLTTFLTMAYIIVVNPLVLGSTGMDHGAVFVATCLSAALGCFLMGFMANYPIALAPSMSLNAYFAYYVVEHLGYAWPTALGAVFLAGLFFALLTLTGVRTWLIHLIPYTLKIGIASGIGLFLALVAGKNLNLITLSPYPHLHWQGFWHIEVGLAALGVGLIFIFEYFNFLGAILLGILIISVLGFFFHLSHFNGIIALPPSLSPTFLKLQFPHTADPKLMSAILIFLYVALFDNTGTLIAVLTQAKLIKPNHQIPRLGQALAADSLANIAGSLLGTSSTGSYIESVTGVKAGGRTGLTAVVVGCLFLLSLAFGPLAKSVPLYATAPALIYVATLMSRHLFSLSIRQDRLNIAAFITAAAIPLSFSIATGICLGFVSYVVLYCSLGKVREVPTGLWGLCAISLIYLLLQL